jgi:hypothetical protein
VAEEAERALVVVVAGVPKPPAVGPFATDPAALADVFIPRSVATTGNPVDIASSIEFGIPS